MLTTGFPVGFFKDALSRLPDQRSDSYQTGATPRVPCRNEPQAEGLLHNTSVFTELSSLSRLLGIRSNGVAYEGPNNDHAPTMKDASELTGKPAPAFTAPVIGGNYHEGDTISLADLKGQNVVLYFYPKDNTPGCTTQACALRDGWSRIQKKAAVFGVSVDPLKSHAKFIKDHNLPFPLLSDETKKIVQAYGVWVEKFMYGKKYMGTERSTVVIGPDGKVKNVLRKVQPAEHLDLVLQALA
jgi:peroxiredoxin Q/BCP